MELKDICRVARENVSGGGNTRGVCKDDRNEPDCYIPDREWRCGRGSV